MGIAKYLKTIWKKPSKEMLKGRLIEWRKGEAVVKVDKPLRLDRARSVGYKAKKGVVVARVRVVRGGHKRPRPVKGRRTKRLHNRKNLTMNYREIAERRAGRKFDNLVVLNSYYLAKDGKHYFYEVILVDPAKPEIKKDKQLNFLVKDANKNRVFRGVTSAGRKGRGLRNSTVKSPKVRPSLRANRRRGN